MRKQMIENAAYEVATQVRSVEDSIDAALTEIAELQGRILRVRSLGTVSVATGQDALQQLVVATQALIGARGSMVGCHAALVTAKGEIPGLRTIAFGEPDECPPQEGSNHLRVVA